jgi:hypothetical protein
MILMKKVNKYRCLPTSLRLLCTDTRAIGGSREKLRPKTVILVPKCLHLDNGRPDSES